jgi:dTDP-4-dehydrorhamnose 3,5-epimerase
MTPPNELEWSSTILPGLIVIEPRIFVDHRGSFRELYKADRYRRAGIDCVFVQDNHSRSMRGVLRGLHYQTARPQAKLVSVVAGTIYDVSVDIRAGSRTRGRWVSFTLDSASGRQIFIPAGFAHGFCVLSDSAEVVYKCSDEYDPLAEGGIIWNDPTLAIDWPISDPILSEKDAHLPPFVG